jgi:hypothetical protein
MSGVLKFNLVAQLRELDQVREQVRKTSLSTKRAQRLKAAEPFKRGATTNERRGVSAVQIFGSPRVQGLDGLQIGSVKGPQWWEPIQRSI